ncbi:MAG: methionyl-tRNA formyltransferase [Bacteroidales bacterium]|nr:methionyl-tRNA formyltransferase [Bacteroidales bacterium]
MDKKTRIIYMGTPEFAVGPLKALLDAGYDIPAVVTVPDKPKGRGLQMAQSDVKKFALERGNIDILQPEKLRDENFLSRLKSYNADLFIVVAFRMLPEVVWKMPKMGTFNLHASLLPKFRGAAPINWAIIQREKETGVATFFIDDKIDTGCILLQEKCPIEERETVETLHDKLMEMGSSLVVKTVQELEKGTITPQPQDASSLTETNSAAPKLNKTNCRIDWSRTAEECDALVRGLSPFPAALATMETGSGETVEMKIFATELSDKKAGKVIFTDKSIFVPCSDKMLEITSLQPAGKKRMGAKDFINGHKNLIDDENIRFF